MSHNNRQRVILPSNALAKLQNERMAAIDSHLQELAKHLAVENADLDLVVRAAIEHGGMPEPGHHETFLGNCLELATRLSRHKLRKLHTEVKAIAVELNVHEAPPAIVWSARRAGVELFEEKELQPT